MRLNIERTAIRAIKVRTRVSGSSCRLASVIALMPAHPANSSLVCGQCHVATHLTKHDKGTIPLIAITTFHNFLQQFVRIPRHP
ncbi:hypothetical protein, partial [Pseudomonas syringae group genomosp. 3]|uniref:hypothetical protein n=1 Tax=Pseudomonas syringae group genomosp. 3 TaxID=251701 RepID=UPI001C8081AD